MLFKTTALAAAIAVTSPALAADDPIFGTWCPADGGEHVKIRPGIRDAVIVMQGETLSCAGKTEKVTESDFRPQGRDMIAHCAVKLAYFSEELVDPSVTGMHFYAKTSFRYQPNDESLKIWMRAGAGGRDQYSQTFERCVIPARRAGAEFERAQP